jgi:hypothetical protein
VAEGRGDHHGRVRQLTATADYASLHLRRHGDRAAAQIHIPRARRSGSRSAQRASSTRTSRWPPTVRKR